VRNGRKNKYYTANTQIECTNALHTNTQTSPPSCGFSLTGNCKISKAQDEKWLPNLSASPTMYTTVFVSLRAHSENCSLLFLSAIHCSCIRLYVESVESDEGGRLMLSSLWLVSVFFLWWTRTEGETDYERVDRFCVCVCICVCVCGEGQSGGWKSRRELPNWNYTMLLQRSMKHSLWIWNLKDPL